MLRDDRMGNDPEDPVFKLTFEAIHHRTDNDQRHDADGDTEGGEQRDKGGKAVIAAGASIS